MFARNANTESISKRHTRRSISIAAASKVTCNRKSNDANECAHKSRTGQKNITIENDIRTRDNNMSLSCAQFNGNLHRSDCQWAENEDWSLILFVILSTECVLNTLSARTQRCDWWTSRLEFSIYRLKHSQLPAGGSSCVHSSTQSHRQRWRSIDPLRCVLRMRWCNIFSPICMQQFMLMCITKSIKLKPLDTPAMCVCVCRPMHCRFDNLWHQIE